MFKSGFRFLSVSTGSDSKSCECLACVWVGAVLSGALSPQVPFPSIRAVPIGSPCLICPFFPKATEYIFAFTALTWLLDFFFFFFSELFRKL